MYFTYSKNQNPNSNIIIENKPLFGHDYINAIRAFDINLCFLRILYLKKTSQNYSLIHFTCIPQYLLLGIFKTLIIRVSNLMQ